MSECKFGHALLVANLAAVGALLAAHRIAGPPNAEIPSSIAMEHKELHAVMESATKERGALGRSAKAVEKLLAPHFEREEEFALPPLSVLPLLAQNKPVPNRAELIRLSARLRAEYKSMVAEHGEIVKVLDKFVREARAARRPQYVRFGEQLKLHALNEEQVLYPSAILVGRYLEGERGTR